MSKSTVFSSGRKPRKPYDGFPLFPHATNRWAKKILQRLHYFGPVTDDDDFGAMAALARYQQQAPDLHAGRTPQPKVEGLTVQDLVNHFLTVKRQRLAAGELGDRAFSDYYHTCERIVEHLKRERVVEHLTPDDFEALRNAVSKGRAPATVSNEIGRVRVVFNHAYKSGLIDKPIRYGDGLAKPSAKTLRTAKAKNGKMMYAAEELRAIVAKAGCPVKAMILLGINCAFGPTDISSLPIAAVDLKNGWIDYPRPKTGIPRRCKLWPETVEALTAALAVRREPIDEADKGLLFVTKYRQRWVRVVPDETGRVTLFDSVAQEFRKILKDTGLARKRLGHYSLRRTFETIAGEVDQTATDHVMGHAPAAGDMASVYRQHVADHRLEKVANHVHRWVFGGQDKQDETR